MTSRSQPEPEPPAAPSASDALQGLPAYPASAPLTAGRWRRITHALAGHHPVIAEFSYFALCTWHGGSAIGLSRIGDHLLVVAFADADAQHMIVAMPGAVISPHRSAELEQLFADHDVRFLTSATIAATALALSESGVLVGAERNDSDYVYAMDVLAAMDGRPFHSMRKVMRRLETRHRVTIHEGRLTESWAVRHLHAAYDRWCIAKYGGLDAVPDAITEERDGLRSWPLDGVLAADIRVFALEVDGEPAGVSVLEPMWDRTWMGVIFKTDPGLDGATAFLRRHVARAGLRDLGPGARLNIQQDDGLPGLRAAKESYRPHHLEPKFAVLRPRPTAMTPC